MEAEVGFPLSGYVEGTSRVPDRLLIPLDKLKAYLSSALNLHGSGNGIYVDSELRSSCSDSRISLAESLAGCSIRCIT